MSVLSRFPKTRYSPSYGKRGPHHMDRPKAHNCMLFTHAVTPEGLPGMIVVASDHDGRSVEVNISMEKALEIAKWIFRQ